MVRRNGEEHLRCLQFHQSEMVEEHQEGNVKRTHSEMQMG